MKLMMGLGSLSLFICFLILPLQLTAMIHLPKIFSDNMVVQRNIDLKIWGWGAPGEAVSVKGSWHKQTYSATVDAEGHWELSCPSPAVGGPYGLDIQGQNRIVLHNLLCGEVWLCSGQSNMEMGLGLVNNAAEEIRNANYPQIRLFDVVKAGSDTSLADVAGTWRECTPETISKGDWEGFSAVAYFFGRRIYSELNVPVGLIDASWGATKAEPWIAPQGYARVPEVSDLYQNRMEMEQSGVWGEPKRPSRIYNAMIFPIKTFPIRGVLWYQGESNVGDGMLYFSKMKALIEGWRQVWGQGDFPFYLVQVAPYKDYAEGELAQLWQAQRKCLELPGTALAVTEDIGDWEDIHPKNKLDVGERLAKLALVNIYRKK